MDTVDPTGDSPPIPWSAPSLNPAVAAAVVDWYDGHARTLPWRAPHRTAWGVLVSEVMLQQTPVARVLPVWTAWLARWPTPAALAAAPRDEVLRAWGRLGYPRRALRLHAAAEAIVARHGGRVPGSPAELLDLPGIGAYTAAAVACFAFGVRTAVVDTNVRRVEARLVTGHEFPARSLSAAESALAVRLLPADPALAARWNVSVMELGALVCTARSPSCEECPVRAHCAWYAAGRPAAEARPRGQAWAGTDRQVRGALMAAARAAHVPLTGPMVRAGLPGAEDVALPAGHAELALALRRLAEVSRDPEQRERALAGLVADGLLVAGDEGWRLPT